MVDEKWSNLGKVVYKRTYARNDSGRIENWEQTVDRVIRGNISKVKVTEDELNRLRYFLSNRIAGPAGRGWWFSGAPAHSRIGGAALVNCWSFSMDDWQKYVEAQDLLMLGGGVGMSVEHRFVSKLPKVKKNVRIVHRCTKDASFIVPDSREGWCDLTYRILESYFATGKSFDYSTFCIRGQGEPISGFGGSASGPRPLVEYVEKVTQILEQRAGRHLRPIDAMDIICCIGELVVAGNVRRSALILLGDPWDKEYLKSKRWDLGQIPTQRAMANLSVVCDDVDDLHPLFWKTYEHGEPFGLINRKNIQQYGRMGEKRKDSAYLVNPCVPAGTQILTDNGYVNIEEVVGIEINVWNGFEFSKVTPQITGYNQPLVNVNLSSGQILVCTEAHKFVIAENYRGDTIRKQAIDLEEGDKLIKCNFPVIEHGIAFPKAYSQGFYSGDGSKGYREMSLYGEKIDKCHVRLNGKKIGARKNEKQMFKLDFEPFAKEFVPFEWDLKSRLDWFAGLLDSDGTELKEGGAQIGSIDFAFLLSIQKMLTTMGQSSKISLMHEKSTRFLPDGRGGKKEYECQTCWRLLINSVQIQNLKNMGMSCSRLSFNKSPQRDASRFVTVVSVQDAGVADVVYCFTEPKRNLGCFEGVVTGQCGEAVLENNEPCNLQELALPSLKDEKEFVEAARLMHRWGKRVTCESYHQEGAQEVISRNRRIGTGITGCLASPLFNPSVLDTVYKAIQEENVSYSKELGIPESIRTTVVKPSGTISKVFDMNGYEGIHPAYSRYFIQRIRFAANDPIVPFLRIAGHHVEPVVKFDGSFDRNTVVVDFYESAPEGFPIADENWDTWKQLDTLKMAQKYWADQAVSVTVYYKKEEISKIKEWLQNNYSEIKTISFLCHSDHGFKQAPKEAITKEKFEVLSERVSPLDIDSIDSTGDIQDADCEGGACPVK